MREAKATEARTWPNNSALFLLLLPVCIVGAVLLAKGLYPVDLPSVKNPDFIDTVFDNRGVLWAARLLLVSAAVVLVFGEVFIVVSIGTRMKNGEWLRRRTLMTRAELDKEVERLLRRNQAAIQRARKRSERLARTAKRSDPALERALERLRQTVR
jgi:hypothetical protein